MGQKQALQNEHIFNCRRSRSISTGTVRRVTASLNTWACVYWYKALGIGDMLLKYSLREDASALRVT